MFDNHVFVCYNFTSDLPDWPTQPFVDVRELDVLGGMTAGKPYVLSIQMGASPGQTFEVWGAGSGSSGTCNDAGELLYRGAAQTGPLCLTLQAKQDHVRLLMVMSGQDTQGYGYASFTECPAGTCPN